MPTQWRAETPSPWAALLRTLDVDSQPGRPEIIEEANGEQSRFDSEMGIDITRQNRPNWVGRLLMECNKD